MYIPTGKPRGRPRKHPKPLGKTWQGEVIGVEKVQHIPDPVIDNRKDIITMNKGTRIYKNSDGSRTTVVYN